MNKRTSSDHMLEAMQNMHGITTQYAMALVAYVAIKRASNLPHYEILKLLGVGNQGFSAWSQRCYGKNISDVVAALRDGRSVDTVDTCVDGSAKRAIDFIASNKS